MTYDGADGYVIMYGGDDGQGNSGICNGNPACPLVADTWTFLNGLWSWQETWDGVVNGKPTCWTDPPIDSQPGPCPGPRMDAAMTYDSGDGYVVLFGGCTGLGATQNYCSSEAGDTWKWSGGSWSQLSVTGSPPSARSGAAIADDSFSQGVVLFGGQGACGVSCSDTYEFVSGQWRHLTTRTIPPARSGASMVFFPPVLGDVIMFGGDSGGSSGLLNDLWRGYVSGFYFVWVHVSVSGPAPRSNYSLAFSYPQNAAILEGGWSGSTAYNDSWALTYSGGTFSWTQWCPVPGTGYSCPTFPRWGAAMSTEGYSSTSRIVMFGGAGSERTTSSFAQCLGGDSTNQMTGTVQATCYLDGTWETYGPDQSSSLGLGWTQSFLDGSPTTVQPIFPSPRTGAVMTQAEGGTADYVILFGGVDSSGNYLGDTWAYEYPAPLSASYGPASDWVQIGTCGDFSAGQNPCTAGMAPPPRANASFAYRPGSYSTQGYDVLYGGCNPCSGSGLMILGDTWVFTSTQATSPTGTWTAVSPGSPGWRMGAQFTYNETGGVGSFILFGGYGCTRGIIGTGCPTPGYLSDTWSFTATTTGTYAGTGTWSLVTLSSGSGTPGARDYGGLSWDTSDGFALMFGGFEVICPTACFNVFYGDTWAFTGTSTGVGTWSQLESASTSGCTLLSTGGNVPCPSPREMFGMDGANGARTCGAYSNCQFPILFGGESSSYAPLGDMWIYRLGSWSEVCGATRSNTCGIPGRANFAFTGGTENYFASATLCGGTIDLTTDSVVFDSTLVNSGGVLQAGPGSFNFQSPVDPDWSQ